VALLFLIIPVVGFVVMGVSGSAGAVAWPSVAETFARPDSDLGVIIAVAVTGYGGASLLQGKLARHFSTGTLLIGGAACIVIGLTMFATVSQWSLLLPGALLSGSGGAVVGNTFNVHMAITGNKRGMNLMHAGYGGGATLGPLLITAVLGLGLSWRVGYAVLIGLHAVMLLAYVSTLKHWGDPLPADPPPTTTPRSRVSWTALIPPVVLFALYTGFEQATGSWSYTLFTEGRGIGQITSGLLVAGFWASLASGRIVVATVGSRLSAATALGGGTMVALIGAWLLWWAPHTWVAGIGLLIIGAGLSPAYPAMMSLTPGRVGSNRTATAVGLQAGSGALGNLLLPAGMKLIVDAFDITVVAPVLFGGAAALALAVTMVYPWRARHQKDAAP